MIEYLLKAYVEMINFEGLDDNDERVKREIAEAIHSILYSEGLIRPANKEAAKKE